MNHDGINAKRTFMVPVAACSARPLVLRASSSLVRYLLSCVLFACRLNQTKRRATFNRRLPNGLQHLLPRSFAAPFELQRI